MIEVRQDYCVNIFPTGNNFSCTFFNVQGAVYLIADDPSLVHPPCCLFGRPWHPPAPTFLRDDQTATMFATAPWGQQLANWWILPSVDPPTGPFYFAFRNNSSPQVYLSFTFPGVEGFVVQNFFNIKYQRPDPSVWIIPDQCQIPNLPDCGFDPKSKGY